MPHTTKMVSVDPRPPRSTNTIGAGADDLQASTEHERDAEHEAGIVVRDRDGGDERHSAEHHPDAAQEIVLPPQHGRMATGPERLSDPPSAHPMNKDGI